MSELQELHPLARRFAEEYCVDFHVGKASERAGIDRSHGATLLRDPRVEALITDQKRKTSGRINLSVDMILDTVRAVLATEIVDAKALVVTKDAQGQHCLPYIDLSTLTEDQRKAVKGVKWTKEGAQIEFYNKLEAAKMAGQFFTMWKDGLELSGPGGGPVVIDETLNAKDAMELYRGMIEGGK